MGPGIRYPTGRGHSADLKLSHETICRLICVHLQGEELKKYCNTVPASQTFANASQDPSIR
jgi:hypothetical protein